MSERFAPFQNPPTGGSASGVSSLVVVGKPPFVGDVSLVAGTGVAIGQDPGGGIVISTTGGGGGAALFELEVVSPMMGAVSEVDHSPYDGADVEVAVWEEVGLRDINGNIGAQWVRDAVDELPLLGCSGHFTIAPNPFAEPFAVGCRVTDGIDPGGFIDQAGPDVTAASAVHLDANVPDIAFLQVIIPSSRGRAVVVPWSALQMTSDAYKVRRKPGDPTIVQFSFVGGPGSAKAWYQVRVPS